MSKSISTIEKLMDGYNPMRQRMEETRGLVKKWEPTGLLEGLKDEQKVQGMAVLLENQARQLIDEASSTSTASNSEEWSGVALPLICLSKVLLPKSLFLFLSANSGFFTV